MEVREAARDYSKRRYTIEEYLEMENAAAEKHEYYQGEVFAMSRVKMPHNKLVGNLYYRLRQRLEGKSCTPHTNGTRVHVERNTLLHTLIFLLRVARK